MVPKSARSSDEVAECEDLDEVDDYYYVSSSERSNCTLRSEALSDTPYCRRRRAGRLTPYFPHTAGGPRPVGIP